MLCTLSNGYRAVVKYPNNVEGSIVLINEFVSYKIAQAIGLSCPECDTCILDEKASYSQLFLEQQNKDNIINPDNFGLCFYSRFIESAFPFKKTFPRKTANADDFQNMILFDHIIYNKDRHEGNMLLNSSNKIFYAIDHSHVFKNDCIWDKNCFNYGMKNNDYNDDNIIRSNFTIYNYIWRFKQFDLKHALEKSQYMQSILTPQFISDIIKQLPSEWFTTIDSEDVQCLGEYLNYRIAHLQDISLMIYKTKEELYYEKN